MRRVRAGRRPPLLFIAVGLVAAIVGLLFYGFDLLRRSELDTVDARFSIRGDESPPSNIVLVDVDGQTLHELNGKWPFPNSVHGRAIDRLYRDRPQVIAYDIQLSEETHPERLVQTEAQREELEHYGLSPGDGSVLLENLGTEEDNALAIAQRKARSRLVLATTEVTTRGQPNVLGIDYTKATAGNASLPFDPGGVLRRLPYEVGGLKSFAVATAEKVTGDRVSRSSFGDGTTWIDYHGPPATFPRVRFSDVVKGRTRPGLFRGKVVVVGVSVPSLHDIHATSVGEGMPGPEVQANAISSVLRDFPLDTAPGILSVVLVVLFALAAPLASLRLRGRQVLALTVGLGAGYALLTQLAFSQGMILPFLYPLVALVVGAVGTVIVNNVTAIFERQHVRDVFSRFVPEQVVDEALDCAGDDLRLPAVRRQCTVMFADLRGFTTCAEALRPERVVEILNRYLSEMSGAILDNGGTLVAYMGDGIMAVFGAPIEQRDHADRALAAAREMLKRLEGFNEWIRAEDINEGFRIGIGVNSGTVMSGNIGSERRMEYTAIGDTTNAAARLEQMTKDTPYQVLVSDSTRAMLRGDAPDLTYVDAVPVRGKVVKANLWALADQPSAPAPPSSREPAPDTVSPTAHWGE